MMDGDVATDTRKEKVIMVDLSQHEEGGNSKPAKKRYKVSIFYIHIPNSNTF